MSLPAEKIIAEESSKAVADSVKTAPAPIEAKGEAAPSPNIQPALEESDHQIRALLEKTRTRKVTSPKILQSPPPHQPLIRYSRLVQNDFFLAMLVLTALNAFIYVRYSGSETSTVSLKEANSTLKVQLGDDYKYLEPSSDFLNYSGEFTSEDSPEFQSSLKRFREKMAFLGTDPTELFLSSEFFRKNQGIYWSKRLAQSVTRPPVDQD